MDSACSVLSLVPILGGEPGTMNAIYSALTMSHVSTIHRNMQAQNVEQRYIHNSLIPSLSVLQEMESGQGLGTRLNI